MAVHQWTRRQLGRIWLRWLCVHVVLVVASQFWAASQRDVSPGLILVLLITWCAVPTGLFLVTFAWWWSRRRVREIRYRAHAT